MIINISDSGLTTLLSLGTSIADRYGFSDEYSTTVCILTSSLSTSPVNANEVYLNLANNYINSLSNEQIMMLEEKLEQKQDTIKIGDKTFTLEQVAALTTPEPQVVSKQPQQVSPIKQKLETEKTYKKI